MAISNRLSRTQNREGACEEQGRQRSCDGAKLCGLAPAHSSLIDVMGKMLGRGASRKKALKCRDRRHRHRAYSSSLILIDPERLPRFRERVACRSVCAHHVTDRVVHIAHGAVEFVVVFVVRCASWEIFD
eukprot:4938448-Prymnesium_polylepis.5